MNFFNSLNTSLSGLKSERTRMNVIGENIANINSTSKNGTKNPYKRKEVVFKEVLSNHEGVKVVNVREDNSEPIAIFKPEHPDSNDEGYIFKPNISLHFEMVDLISSSRSYQANLSAIKTYKEMIEKTLLLG